MSDLPAEEQPTPIDVPDEATAEPAEPAAAPERPWADVKAEHVKLLRLSPLPFDRDTGARPLRFVEFGRVERHSREQSLLRLTIELPGQRVPSGSNVLEVWADHAEKTVRFGPEKGFTVEPANRGLGRFMLAQAAQWARGQYAHYRVEGGKLPSKDALDIAARARRDHALKSQGFTIEYSDPVQLKATYSAGRVNNLHEDWQVEKVQILELLDAASMLQIADQNLLERDATVRKLEERVERLKRDDNGLRFAVACLIAFCLFQAGLLVWIATQ